MAPATIPWTGDDEADRLLAADANALLIGFVLDQQVPVQKAFSGPWVLRERLGHLDPVRIADMDPAAFVAVCAERPAIHRFPAAMAARVQDLCRVLARDYDGDGSRVWREATDGADLYARIGALPGFGEMKIKSLGAVLAKQFGVEAAESLAPDHPTLGDVRSPDELERYQQWKREYKKARAGAS